MCTYFISCSDTNQTTIQLLTLAEQYHIEVLRLELQPNGIWVKFDSHEHALTQFLITLQKNVQIEALTTDSFEQIIAQSRKMQDCLNQAKKFALLDAPLLLQGETGTGKDLIAKACHQFSQRVSQKFIAVNCAGLPENEAESEMFGYHGNGKSSIGFFEYANGGTVLLDAISELSLEMQAKLLRFLNDGSFRRVGEDKEIRVNVRVICTTLRPLSQLVKEGKMREDLYHRLNVLSITLPPLRERKEDIAPLVEHFTQHISQQLKITPPQYDETFLHSLLNYSWRGNLRELYNAIYRACSLTNNGKLNISDLNLPQEMPSFESFDEQQGSLDEIVGRFEAELLRKFYLQYPSTRKLAQRLGLSHTAVANKLRHYGINK